MNGFVFRARLIGWGVLVALVVLALPHGRPLWCDAASCVTVTFHAH